MFINPMTLLAQTRLSSHTGSGGHEIPVRVPHSSRTRIGILLPSTGTQISRVIVTVFSERLSAGICRSQLRACVKTHNRVFVLSTGERDMRPAPPLSTLDLHHAVSSRVGARCLRRLGTSRGTWMIEDAVRGK